MRSLQRVLTKSFTAALAVWLPACARPTPSSTPLAPPPTTETAPTAGAPTTSPKSSPAQGTESDSQSAEVEPPPEPAVPVFPDDAVWGEAEAPVTIVAFLDFQCPFCARVQPTFDELKSKYGPKQLRFVFKHKPIPPHRHALHAARVARAVLELGGVEVFWSFVALMFEQRDKLDDELPLQLAEKVGLARNKVRALSEESRVKARIEQDITLAQELTITGVPAVRINGISIKGAQPVDLYVKVIDRELEAVNKLLSRGVSPKAIYALRSSENIKRPPLSERTIDLGKAPFLEPSE